MLEKLIGLQIIKSKLEESLAQLTSDGFVEKDGCVFLKSLFILQSHYTEKYFVDNTGYECFVNSIHIDDYVDGDYLIQCVLFMDHVINELEIHKINGSFTFILSETQFGANFKFHLTREKEVWINSHDVDKFEEPLFLRVITIG